MNHLMSSCSLRDVDGPRAVFGDARGLALDETFTHQHAPVAGLGVTALRAALLVAGRAGRPREGGGSAWLVGLQEGGDGCANSEVKLPRDELRPVTPASVLAVSGGDLDRITCVPGVLGGLHLLGGAFAGERRQRLSHALILTLA